MDVTQLSVGQVSLKVTPEELIHKADEVTREVQNIKQCMDAIEQSIRRTEDYWIGEAADLHRTMYDEQKEDIDIIMRRLSEHPRDLVTIAQTYTSVENRVEELANGLLENVID